MTREEAIKELKIQFLGECHRQREAKNIAIKALEYSMTGWIPIKTRPLTKVDLLPDDGQEVLVTNRHGDVDIDTFYKDDGCYFEWNCDDIKAWMPLPEPYKAEREVKGMTRKEAIDTIKEAYGNSEYTDEIINELEQDILNKIRAEIMQLDYDTGDILEIIDKYKSKVR